MLFIFLGSLPLEKAATSSSVAQNESQRPRTYASYWARTSAKAEAYSRESRRWTMALWWSCETDRHPPAIRFRKVAYREVAELRTKMERVHLKDMISLH